MAGNERRWWWGAKLSIPAIEPETDLAGVAPNPTDIIELSIAPSMSPVTEGRHGRATE
jgi:hypothetical protein